jgi:hypothetical protein
VRDVITPKTREAILRALAERALQGDVAAARVLLERTDPALRRQELSGVEGKPLEIDTRALAKLLTKEDLIAMQELAKQIAARSEARASQERARPQDGGEPAVEDPSVVSSASA